MWLPRQVYPAAARSQPRDEIVDREAVVVPPPHQPRWPGEHVGDSRQLHGQRYGASAIDVLEHRLHRADGLRKRAPRPEYVVGACPEAHQITGQQIKPAELFRQHLGARRPADGVIGDDARRPTRSVEHRREQRRPGAQLAIACHVGNPGVERVPDDVNAQAHAA